MRFRRRFHNLAVLADYAPTVYADDATKDAFYLNIPRAINQTHKHGLIINA